MKLRSLFLASLAAMAMVSCSNEDDQIINVPEGETAQMRIALAFPTPTRAENTTEEVDVSNLTVVLEYGNFRKVKTISSDKFSRNGQTVTVEPFDVTAGTNVNIYAFLNSNTELNEALESGVLANLQVASTGSALDYLADGIAKNNSFLMSNTDGKAIQKALIANTLNEAIIPVERVCAKLTEMSPTTAFEVTPSETVPESKKLNISLLNHTYINLVKDSYVLDRNTSVNDADYDNYLQKYGTLNYAWKLNKAEGVSTYCMENRIAVNNNDPIQVGSTCIIYEAQARIGEENAATFYVWNNEIFLNLVDLAKEYGVSSFDLEGAMTPAEIQAKLKTKYYVDMYIDGKCYYIQPIKTATGSTEIIRNNLYKLTVTGITKLGYPTTDIPDPDPTQLKLTVNIADWTVNDFSFEL